MISIRVGLRHPLGMARASRRPMGAARIDLPLSTPTNDSPRDYLRGRSIIHVRISSELLGRAWTPAVPPLEGSRLHYLCDAQ